MTSVHLMQLSYAKTGPAQQLAADMFSPTGGGFRLWPRAEHRSVGMGGGGG